MAVVHHRSIFLFVLLSLLAVAAQADTEEQLQVYVNDNTQRMVEQLNRERELYQDDSEAFYSSMNQTMEGFVDFRRIAARVMGRYARQASPEQRDQFVEKFKRSLFESYAQTLVESRNFRIEVLGATFNPRDDNRASVDMQVITETGNRYPVTYSMYRAKNDQWMMENVIVEGVNIGLAFRDRFSQEMEANRDQVQVVIDGWNDAADSLGLDQTTDEKAEQ
ncbi:MAG: ABC transporter substrate-binding protein [Marinobacter sp.]